MEELKNMPHEERLKYLHDSADTVLKNEEYSRALTEDELREAKDRLTDIVIKKSAIEAEKKEVTKQYSEEIKEHAKLAEEEMGKVKTGFLTTTGTIYEMVDYEESLVYQYDAQGLLIRKRPMEGKDRQTRIKELREGTND